MVNESLLKPFSIGIVARDILEDDLYVDIAPIELHPNLDGELTSPTEYSNTIASATDEVEVIKVTKTNLIKAKWLPYGDTNRLEPPTVCKGESVVLYRYSDTDKYYWTTLYNQLEYRKLEKRTIVLSNKKSINVAPDALLDNSYYMTTDTINKVIKLHTSTTDGEYTEYDITIDTADGQFELIDGKGNRIYLNSQDDLLELDTNSDIVTNTQHTTHNSDTDMTINTTDRTENVSNHLQINLKTYAVDNGSDELIQTITDFVQAVSDAIGIGNVGAPVPMDGDTKSALAAIKARFAGFM